MSSYIIREIIIENSSKRIYGLLYLPLSIGKVSIAIYAHELANTHERGIEYAKYLASHGIACYIFDFCGGSNNSKSSGKTTEMSFLTEKDDLSLVVNYFRKESIIDKENIFIIGASFGGGVASLYASENIDIINSLILLYPGFNVYDSVHEAFQSLEDVPIKFSFKGWMDVSKRFIKDTWNLDLLEHISLFTKPVLILHGDKDKLVSLEYSKKAVNVFPNSKLIVIKGANHHIFFKEHQKLAQGYILNFILENIKKKED